MATEIITVSGKARHGKDTSAEIMKDYFHMQGYNVAIVHYADLLKYLCKQYFNWDGEKDAAGRAKLQYVGTDLVRKNKPDFWVKFVQDLVKYVLTDYDIIIIPDARFPNEIVTWWDPIPYTVKVERPNFDNGLTEEQKNHPSETALDGFTFDYLISAENYDILRLETEKFCQRYLIKKGM